MGGLAIKLILPLALLGLVTGQKGFQRFPAAYTRCNGVLTVNDVRISAPLALKANCLNRHLLVKKRRVQICINATLPLNSPVVFPVSSPAGLKNSAHGTLPAIPIPQDFCDIAKDACQNALPPCSEWVGGMNVQFCSELRVPEVPIIQPDVLVRWRILHDQNFNPSSCERRYEAAPNQIPLVCIDIKAKVVDRPRCPPPLLG
jgi:hypothetical protein